MSCSFQIDPYELQNPVALLWDQVKKRGSMDLSRNNSATSFQCGLTSARTENEFRPPDLLPGWSYRRQHRSEPPVALFLDVGGSATRHIRQSPIRPYFHTTDH